MKALNDWRPVNTPLRLLLWHWQTWQRCHWNTPLHHAGHAFYRWWLALRRQSWWLLVLVLLIGNVGDPARLTEVVQRADGFHTIWITLQPNGALSG